MPIQLRAKGLGVTSNIEKPFYSKRAVITKDMWKPSWKPRNGCLHWSMDGQYPGPDMCTYSLDIIDSMSVLSANEQEIVESGQNVWRTLYVMFFCGSP